MTGRHVKSKTPARVTETSDYVAMMLRIFDGYAARIADDPVALAHLRDLQAGFDGAVNRGIFAANQGTNPYSQNDMAKVLGTSRQAIQQRIKKGADAHAAYHQARGAGAVHRIGDIRARRAELLGAAGVQDMTGSVRELRAAQ